MRGGLALRDCLERLPSAVNRPSPKNSSNESALAVGSKVGGGESSFGTDRCQQRADSFSGISIEDIYALSVPHGVASANYSRAETPAAPDTAPVLLTRSAVKRIEVRVRRCDERGIAKNDRRVLWAIPAGSRRSSPDLFPCKPVNGEHRAENHVVHDEIVARHYWSCHDTILVACALVPPQLFTGIAIQRHDHRRL